MREFPETCAVVLVTGGLGVVGSRLVRLLVEKGYRVRALDIPNHPHADRLDGTGAEVVTGDITKSAGLVDLLHGVDIVFHLAAVLIARDPEIYEQVNVQGTKNLLDASMAAGVGHFIFVSSASVIYPHTTPYSISKQAGERMIREQTVMDWTIVRPTLVYSRDGGEEFRMFKDALTRFPWFTPLVGNGGALKRPVHVDDLIAGLLAVPENERAFGKTYALSGGEPISIRDLAHLLLDCQNARRIFLPIPVLVCRWIAFLMRLAMKNPPLTGNAIAGVIQDADLDPAEAREDLGYHPMGIREGLRRIHLLPS